MLFLDFRGLFLVCCSEKFGFGKYSQTGLHIYAKADLNCSCAVHVKGLMGGHKDRTLVELNTFIATLSLFFSSLLFCIGGSW